MLQYEGLAVKLAHRYARQPSEREDLRQVAMLALLKALDRFDPGRGHSFTTFAWATITGELKRHRRDTEWSMHIPRGLQESYLGVAAAMDSLPVELGREPDARDIARATGEPEDVVRECMGIRITGRVSIDGGPDPDDTAQSLPVDEAGIGRVEDRDALVRALDRLAPPDREVVVLRFVEGMTQDAIASRVGGSQMRVSRTLARSLERLRGLLGPTVRA